MYSRIHPYSARIKERYLLTGPTSSKKTYHVILDLHDAHIPYRVVDSIGVLPQNDPDEIEQIIQLVGDAPGLATFLLHQANISRVSLSFLKSYAPHCISDHVNTFLHSHSLLDILQLLRPSIQGADLMRSLLPLMPRFYSIANSPKVFPQEIHLTIAYVEYTTAQNHTRRGVGSHFLCNLALPHTTPIPIYVQPSHNFSLPEDPNASLIFIGPGTGIAPFRAFLQERLATQAMGRNWLFFGERNRASDFLYESFWMELEQQERLRLDLAFSRDSPHKIYVQHRLYEQRKSVWNWMADGAYLYVCGDAEEMAKEVEEMLRTIAHEEGGLTIEAARLWIKKLRTEKRYMTDVY